MRKAAVVIILTALLSLTAAGTQSVNLVNANPTYPNPMDPYVIFNSPTNNSIANGIGTITLDIDVGTITNGQCPGESYELTYSLDGQAYKPISLVYKGVFSDNSMPHTVYAGRTSWPSLSEGNHTIAAHCIFKIGGYTLTGDNKVFFNVDKTPPQISVLTLENTTYDTTDLPLNFTVNEPFSGLSYSLDGKDYQIEGNATLAGLTIGRHSLIVYAQDKAGNIGASETLTFNVAAPFLLVLVAAAVVIAVAAVAGLFYLRKRKRQVRVHE